MAETGEDRQRLLLIGLDGATLDLLGPMMESNLLPNLAGVAKRGVIGPLSSVWPPFSATAWASFATGLNPGKHGLFDFRLPVALSPERSFANARHIRAATLWRVLSEAGKRVGVLNVPMTYPPERVNGFLVGGILEGLGGQSCSWPDDLYQKLSGQLPGYKVELDWNAYREALNRDPKALVGLIRDVGELGRQRARAALWMMDELDWDFFAMVFVGPDRLQHFIWKHVDPSHPAHRPEEAAAYRGLIEDYYRELDSAVGALIKRAGDGVNLIVMSDHGFGPQLKKFALTRWLVEQGYLRLRGGKQSLRSLLKKFDIAGLRKRIPARFTRGLRSSLNIFSCIDWSQTRAYPGTSSEQGIYINLRGREHLGTVSPGQEYGALIEEICAELKALEDPEDGRPVVDKIFKQAEVFNGPYSHLGPDVLFSLRGMSYLAKEDSEAGAVFESSGIETGSHRLDGLLMAQGPDIGTGRLKEARLIDLMPTVLHLLDLPISKGLDGRLLEELIRPGSGADRPPDYMETSGEVEGAGQSYTKEEEEELARKLRGLGYMG